jgi:hypothetical protein
VLISKIPFRKVSEPIHALLWLVTTLRCCRSYILRYFFYFWYSNIPKLQHARTVARSLLRLQLGAILFGTTDGSILNFQPVSFTSTGLLMWHAFTLCENSTVRYEFCSLKFKNDSESSHAPPPPPGVELTQWLFFSHRSIQSILAVQSVSPSITSVKNPRFFLVKDVQSPMCLPFIVARTTKIKLPSPFRIHIVSIVLFTSGLHMKLWQIPLFNFAHFLFQSPTPHG